MCKSPIHFIADLTAFEKKDLFILIYDACFHGDQPSSVYR